MPRGGGQSGQATIEWAGLVLCVALILGALLAGGREAAKGDAGRGLGEAVAERITCAVRERCGAEVRERGAQRLGRGIALGAPLGNPPGGRVSLLSPSPGGRAGLRRALRVVGGAKRFLKRTWFPCLGFRSWQNDREHPRLLGEGLPVKQTADLLNECVNPLSFLFGK
jgi:hypothetical protein